MIGFLRGKVAGSDENTLLLDVSGVGFEIYVGPGIGAYVNKTGDELTVYTYMAVKEDDISLYGFLSKDELKLFKLLLSVSGIGPKGAMQIISAMGTDDLRFAILTGDAKGIAKSPGIGLKTAQKLILELKDKIGAVADGTDSTVKTAASAFDVSDIRGEAAEALMALGYSSTESYRAVKSAFEAEEINDANTLLKKALKYL